MAFDAYNANATTSDKPSVDFDALNRYVVETAKLQQPETLIGVITYIVDLGTQKQNDAQYAVDKEDEGLTVEQLTEKHSAEIEKGSITKFATAWDNDAKEFLIKKFVPQKDFQSVVFAVDFPDIMLDKGQFFGDAASEPKPLRLWIGGQFWNKQQGKMLVQNVIPLKVTKDDKITGWTMSPRSTLYKMALGSKLINTDEAFLPENVDALVGKSLLFKAQVFFKKGTDGKEYYTEKLVFAAGLARDQKPKELPQTYVIQFNQENDPQGLKEIRGHVLNTIKNAVNFEGSAIQKQLNGTAAPAATPANAKTPAPSTPAPVVAAEALDEDIPF